MLSIEIAGCTGSGKTTLARATREVIESRGIPVFSPFELVFGRRAQRLVPTRAQSVLLDLSLLPLSILFWVRHGPLTWLLVSHLLHRPASAIRTAARARSIAGKMAVHVLLRAHRSRPGVVVIDEGVVHTVHNVFVYGAATASSSTIDEFATLVPLSDRVVIVSSSEREIVDATVNRWDPPIRNARAEEVAEFARKALDLFDAIGRHPRIRPRTLEIRMGRDGMSSARAAALVADHVSALLSARDDAAGVDR